jgi:hypothetical protein
MSIPIYITVGMRVRLRKIHPCGSDEWLVTRSGADVGIVCTGCGRRVMLEREQFERSVRQVVAVPDAVVFPPGESSL